MKILTSFLFLILLGKNVGPENCQDLKNGKFQLLSGDGTVHIINRTEKTQSEKIIESGLVSVFDILWSNNCEYKLFNRRVMEGTDRFPDMKIDTLYCKIIDINGAFHTTETSITESDITVKAKLKRIE